VLTERAVILFEEDARDLELLKTLKAWIVTQMLPPQRYDCSLVINDSIFFDGKVIIGGNRLILIYL
jgi:hypothetical protein